MGSPAVPELLDDAHWLRSRTMVYEMEKRQNWVSGGVSLQEGFLGSVR